MLPKNFAQIFLLTKLVLVEYITQKDTIVEKKRLGPAGSKILSNNKRSIGQH